MSTGSRTPRAAVIGAGAEIFRNCHRDAFEHGIVEAAGVTDVDGLRARSVAAELGCAAFATVETLLAETRPDVAVIVTPHRWHAPIALQCLSSNAHVLVEKPLALDVAEADRLTATAAARRRLLAVCFQHRLRPEIREARRLIADGELGAVQRIHAIQAWTRTQAYYAQAPWRGTVEAGGGAVLTLAVHHLDLFYHLFGMPARVVGWARNVLHPVATEDTVHALFEWSDGLLGFLHVSSGEAGAAEQIEIMGTAGTVVIGAGTLTLRRFVTDLREHVRRSADPFAALDSTTPVVRHSAPAPGHVGMYRNLVAALEGEERLVADGHDGRASVQLANALVRSSRIGREVELADGLDGRHPTQ
jgi:predicted dehydrogenase